MSDSVTVKVIWSPTLGVALLTVSDTAKSAWDVMVSVSVALLLAELGSVIPTGRTVTVLLIVPVALGLIAPLSVMLRLWPFARFNPLQSPLPES